MSNQDQVKLFQLRQLVTTFCDSVTCSYRSIINISSATRFRWLQRADSTKGDTHTWGVRDIYIGPACVSHCSGHGNCDYPRCICDLGYAGPDCSRVVIANPVSHLLCPLRSIAAHRDHFVPHLSVCVSVRWSHFLGSHA